jgi:hypothetical protein
MTNLTASTFGGGIDSSSNTHPIAEKRSDLHHIPYLFTLSSHLPSHRAAHARGVVVVDSIRLVVLVVRFYPNLNMSY